MSLETLLILLLLACVVIYALGRYHGFTRGRSEARLDARRARLEATVLPKKNFTPYVVTSGQSNDAA